MRNTETRISIYEVDGAETALIGPPQLLIRNHWSKKNTMVVIVLPDKSLTVRAEDLLRAISNATNYGAGE